MTDALLSVKEAQQLLLRHFEPLGDELIPIDLAINRVLRQPIYARLSMPPFDNSSMDGFAVRSADTNLASENSPTHLDVTSDISVGVKPDIMINPGQAARIVTGAMMPDGADAVIPVEETNLKRMEPGSNPPNEIWVYSRFEKGDHVRYLGLDYKKGTKLIESKERLKPVDIGVIAMQGISNLPVYKQPKIGILSTGDELLKPGDEWKPGNIYDANSYVLNTLCTQNGCVCLKLGTASDSEESIRSILNQAVVENVDLILTTAGVSMGAFDYVRSVMEKDGEINFWRVNMRPGKPLMFGSFKEVPLIGLPGNPVSAYIGFEVFVRPVLNKLSGLKFVNRVSNVAILLESIESDGRESYLRVNIFNNNGEWQAKLTGHQGSGNLMSLVIADALIIVPAGVKYLHTGSKVEFWPMD